MEWLVISGFAAAVAVGALAVIMQVNERVAVRDSLRRLDGYQVEGARDQALLGPAGERTATPVVETLTNVAKRYTPIGYADRTRHKIVLAGSPTGLDIDEILVFKMLGLASGLLWILVFWILLDVHDLFGVALVAVAWAASFFAPDIMLNGRVERRQHRIRVMLPDILDLLTISVEAGLGFEQAIERTSASVPGPLTEEFRRMLQETRIGASRSDALRALDERTDVPELRSFILAMLQADTFGVSIARILRAQADEMRVRRRLRAQELAQKAPVKMLPPLVFCIFPSIFVVILAPAVIKLAQTL
jgi:tight adherence protein C